jgi:hypothetical protein
LIGTASILFRHRYQSAVAEDGVDALLDASRKKPNLCNRVEEATEAAVTAFALELHMLKLLRNTDTSFRFIFAEDSEVSPTVESMRSGGPEYADYYSID